MAIAPVLAVGFLMGFRPSASLSGGLGVTGPVVLAAKSPESAGLVGVPLMAFLS